MAGAASGVGAREWAELAKAADETVLPVLSDLRAAHRGPPAPTIEAGRVLVLRPRDERLNRPPPDGPTAFVFVASDDTLSADALARLVASSTDGEPHVLSATSPALFELPPGTHLDGTRVASTALRRRPPVPWPLLAALVPRELLERLDAWALFRDQPFERAFEELGRRAWTHKVGVFACDDVLATARVVAPPVSEAWSDFRLLNPLRLQSLRLLADASPPCPRVLHVIHNFGGLAGTELYTRALIDGLRGQVDSAVLYPDDLDPTLADRDALVTRDPDGLLRVQMNRELAPTQHIVRGAPLELRGRLVERFFAEVVAGFGADIVHIQHLATFGSFLLPLVARRLGARVVITLHDYYLLCADWNLIGPEGVACNRTAVQDDEGCRRCLGSKRQARDPRAPFDWSPWIGERTTATRAALEAADVAIAPSQFVRDQFRSAWGDEVARKIIVVPHGTRPAVARPRPTLARTRLRVAFLGHLLPEKGRAVFLQAVRRLQGQPVDFVVLGAADDGPDLAGLKVERPGPFRPDELPDKLADVDAVVVASVWHETYGYTLDEAYRAGLPVIAARVGAFGERVRPDETGLLFEPGDPAGLAAAVQRLIDDRELRDRLRAGVRAVPLKTMDENVREYGAIYQELLRPALDPAALLRTRFIEGLD